MKKLRQSVFRPLLFLMAFLAVATSASAWNYSLKQYAGNDDISLDNSWDSSSKCYRVELSGKQGNEYNVKIYDNTQTKFYGNASNNQVNDNRLEATLSENGNAFKINTNKTIIVEIYTEGDKGYNPSRIVFFPKSTPGPQPGGDSKSYLIHYQSKAGDAIWSNSSSYSIKAGGSYTFTVSMQTGSHFGIKAGDGNAFYCANQNYTYDVRSGDDVTNVSSSNGNGHYVWQGSNGKVNITVYVNENCIPYKVTLSQSNDQVSTDQEWYLMGHVKYGNTSYLDKNSNDLLKFTKAGNDYVLNGVLLPNVYRYVTLYNLVDGKQYGPKSGDNTKASIGVNKFGDGNAIGLNNSTNWEIDNENALYNFKISNGNLYIEKVAFSAENYDFYLQSTFSNRGQYSDGTELQDYVKFELVDGVYKATYDTGNMSEGIKANQVCRVILVKKGSVAPKYDAYPFSYAALSKDNSADYFPNNTQSKDFYLTSGGNVIWVEGGTRGILEFTLSLDGNKNPNKLTIANKGQRTEPEYYFVGDMNDWFSYEFEQPVEVKGELVNKGMNHEKMQAEKSMWKFKKSDVVLKNENGQDESGWYEFKPISPDNVDKLIYGEFQIFDGSSKKWEGEVYVHNKQVIVDNNVVNENQYRAYHAAPITRANINGQKVITSSSNNGIERKNLDGNGTSTDNPKKQANLHLECNAVKDATIYFKPEANGVGPKLVITGDPIDYYIFYAMNPITGQTDDKKVTSQIKSGKPNVNNYFLPGIKYSKVLPNEPNGPHMNMDGGIDLKECKGEPVKDDEGNVVSYKWSIDDFSGAIIKENSNIEPKGLQECILAQKLPNGIDLSKYGTIWVQKIPSGFEYPAGRKYTMQFINARNQDDKMSSHNVTTDHMYFFPLGAMHVHFHTDLMANYLPEDSKNTFEVSYRVYTQDEAYNTVVINHNVDPATGETTSVEHVIIATRGETVENTSINDNIGWIELGHNHADSYWLTEENQWMKPEKFPISTKPNEHEYAEITNWNVKCTKPECGWEHYNGGVSTYADEDATGATTDSKRFPEWTQFSQAYVQFRIKFKYYGDDAADGQGTDKVYFMPPAPTVRDTPHHTKFNGQDVYVAPAYNLRDIVTGISKIPTDEEYFEGVNAEPVYYNLQGVRVQNPTKGLYIKVTGNKSEKVIF